MKKGPTGRYGILQAGYYFDFLIITSFAALFLGERGFTTAEIGLVTAGGALLSCVLQQVSGTIADKSDKPLNGMLALFAGLELICFAAMWLLPDSYYATFAFFLTATTLHSSTAPILNSLCLQFTNNGYELNFGLTRSMGSIAYASAALLMGTITDRFGGEIIMPISLAVYAVVFILLITFPKPVKDENSRIVAGKGLIKEPPSTTKEFFSKYHRFMVLLLGALLMWFPSKLVGTYMLYFVEYYGGTSSDMGLALSIMAFSEIPFILFGTNLMKVISSGTMLRIAAVGGVIKIILYMVSPNIFAFTWSNAMNMFLSGFYQVSVVYYCYSIVGINDAVKSQTVLGIAVMGVSGMLANYLGGILLESISIFSILIMCLIVSIIAMIIIFYATSKNTFKNEPVRKL